MTYPRPLGLHDVIKGDLRTLKLEDYVDPEALSNPGAYLLPNVPPLALDSIISSWPMYQNDVHATCGPAALAHLMQGWRDAVAAGEKKPKPRAPLEPNVIEFYGDVTEFEGARFDPATGANDNGVNLLDLLNVARTKGVGGHKIGAYAKVGLQSYPLIDWASCAFGGLLQGYSLPAICQDGRSWSFTPPSNLLLDYAPGSWGRHATCESKNNRRGNMADPTWGSLMSVARSFKQAYRDEVYVMISPEWLDDHSKAPSGLDMVALTADLAKVTTQAGGKK